MPVSLVLFLAPLHDAMHTAVMIIANVNVLILIVGVLKLFPYTLITQYFPFCDTPAPLFFYKYSERRVQYQNQKSLRFLVFWIAEPHPILYKYSERRVQYQNQKSLVLVFWDCRAASFLQ
ncbi:MAG: hypothetical protein BHV84_03410 [Prevotella sp. AG:487_50_53]|nr:MAG: hypothetical protein BHV84_03410 [Prevotella sp. AG:487_50_53]